MIDIILTHGPYVVLLFFLGALWGASYASRHQESSLAVITRYFEELQTIWKHDRTRGLRIGRRVLGGLGGALGTVVYWILHLPLDISQRLTSYVHRRALGLLPAWTADYSGVVPDRAGPIVPHGDATAIRRLAEEGVETWGERRLPLPNRIAYYNELDVAPGVFRRLQVTLPKAVPEVKDFGFSVVVPLTSEGSRRLQTGNAPFSTLSRTTGDVEVKPGAAAALLIQGVATVPRCRRHLDKLWRVGLKIGQQLTNEEAADRIRGLMMNAIASNICQQIVDLCPDWEQRRPVILADTCGDFMVLVMKGWGFDQLPNAVDGTILWRLELERSETLNGKRFVEQPLSNMAETFVRHLRNYFPRSSALRGYEPVRSALMPPSLLRPTIPREHSR